MRAGKAWRGAVFALIGLTMASCGRGDVEIVPGGSASWSDWQGKWLVINYWAAWCAPCRTELPEFNELNRQAGGSDVVVLGVNYDGITGPALQELIDEFSIEFPILLQDPAARWNQERPSILPTTLVIAPDGELRATLVGPQTLESLRAAVGLESGENDTESDDAPLGTDA